MVPGIESTRLRHGDLFQVSTNRVEALRRKTRRRIWLSILAAIACAMLSLGLWALWLEPASLLVSEERIGLRWPAPHTLRVAILTDLHVGSPFNGIEKLREVVDRTNGARPDIICILGDLVIQGVIGGHFVPPEEIADELKRLRHRPGS